MRVIEGRGHLWTMQSGSILEQAKLGQLRIIFRKAQVLKKIPKNKKKNIH